VLVIEADGETLRIVTEDLARWRSSHTVPGAVGCGSVLPASRVFATFGEHDASVTASSVDGHAIAIELLPDDFTPQ
jgi:hypothetical protein